MYSIIKLPNSSITREHLFSPCHLLDYSQTGQKIVTIQIFALISIILEERVYFVHPEITPFLAFQ